MWPHKTWEPSANAFVGMEYIASLLGPTTHAMEEGCSGYHFPQQLLCNSETQTDAPHVSLCREWGAEDKLLWL